MTQQPAAYINLEIYDDESQNMMGVAKVKLPDVTYPCVTVSGAGMMGNMEVPLYGMVDTMTTNIDWLTPNGDSVKLMAPTKHKLDMRVVEEYWESEQAEVGLWADKYVMVVRPKSTTMGDVAPMSNANVSGSYVVYYYAGYWFTMTKHNVIYHVTKPTRVR